MIAPMGVVDAAVHTLKSRMIGHCGFSIGELIWFAATSLDIGLQCSISVS